MVTKVSDFKIDALINKSVKTSIALLASATVFSSVGLVKQDAAYAMSITLDNLNDGASYTQQRVSGVLTDNNTSLTVTPPVSDLTSGGAFGRRTFKFTDSTGIPNKSPNGVALNSDAVGSALRTGANTSGILGPYQWTALYRFTSALGTTTFGAASNFIGTDITDGLNNSQFSITQVGVNLNGGNTANITLRAYNDTTGLLGTQTIALNNVTTTYNFDFSNYGGASGISTNLGAVEIQLDFTSNTPSSSSNFDFSTFQATAVPFDFEPSAGIAILGAGFGLNKVRKTMKEKKGTKV